MNNFIDISIPIIPNDTRSCSAFEFEHSKSSQLLSCAKGDSVNALEIQFIPHAHGTHTETIAHICKSETLRGTCINWVQKVPPMMKSIYLEMRVEILSEKWMFQDEWTCDPLYKKSHVLCFEDCYGDFVITSKSIASLPFTQQYHKAKAIIVHPFINEKALQKFFVYDYHHQNAFPYFTPLAMRALKERYPNVDHILYPFSSIDKPNDKGSLFAHKVFFNADESFHHLDEQITRLESSSSYLEDPAHQASNVELLGLIKKIEDQGYFKKTITELVELKHVIGIIENGQVVQLNLQLTSIKNTDAVPSRPLIFTQRKKQ